MARIQRLYQELEVFRATALRLRGEALPSARAALDSIHRGYREGLYTYLELVDARRDRLAIERDALKAAVNFHQTLVTLEQLTGTGLTGQWTLTPNGIEGATEPYEASEPEPRSHKDRKSTRLNSSHVATSHAVSRLQTNDHQLDRTS